MEHDMDWHQAAVRLLLCGGLAAAAVGAADRVSALEPYRPWLEEHRLEAGAALAAVLFGLSLLLVPLPEKGKGEEPDPCDGYSPVS